ncbi:plasmid mobilization relaxosome protein MobC [Halomonas sp. ZH2S]|uniref:Plasmid mobilization relaxosome protein MobC n=1 Tax=Vreelandella zhuhanensis TaxID=2684210 RepID=A0A7X3H3D3_9GAMM|nr:plasmid mobilization relaxosome protein MobC [Halomonas zhuhanensis]MWJ29499.1 plasmid mobilization relaxosome protein MobC [Halomonas zhuhanensis]
MDIENEKEKNNRTKLIKVRVNESEYQKMKELSTTYGKPMATIMRETTFQAFKTSSNGKHWNIRQSKPDPALIRAFTGIGTNLNQITRNINTIAKEGDFGDVTAVHCEIVKIREAIEALIAGFEEVEVIDVS